MDLRQEAVAKERERAPSRLGTKFFCIPILGTNLLLFACTRYVEKSFSSKLKALRKRDTGGSKMQAGGASTDIVAIGAGAAERSAILSLGLAQIMQYRASLPELPHLPEVA